MSVARRAAPEIDRLVLSVLRAIGSTHGDRLALLAADLRLDSLDLLPNLADFLLAGTLTQEVALLRMRYRSPDRVLGRLRELEEKGLIEAEGPVLAPTGSMRVLLEALLAARAEVAATAWRDHHADLEVAGRHASAVAAAAGEDHVVAVVHRSLPEPQDPYLRLHQRLTTLRYIRQHDHAEAWHTRGLSAGQMTVMTPLWLGEPVEPDAPGLDALASAGFATTVPPALTPLGRTVRDAIEADTDVRAAATFGVLDEASGAALLGALQRLPAAS